MLTCPQDDSSLHFYLEFKRKDPQITAYPLRINLTQLFQSTTSSGAPICGKQNVDQTNSMYGSRFPNAELSILNPVTADFISSIEVSALEIEDDRCDEITAVTMQPDMELINEPHLTVVLCNITFKIRTEIGRFALTAACL